MGSKSALIKARNDIHSMVQHTQAEDTRDGEAVEMVSEKDRGMAGWTDWCRHLGVGNMLSSCLVS